MSFIKHSADSEGFAAKTASASACIRHQDNSKGAVRVSLGRFEVDFEMSTMQRRILEQMQDAYTDEMLETVLRPILEQHEGSPSCRSIDWMLTNYAKSRRVVCRRKDGEPLNIFVAYKRVLGFYRRRNFDVFRRKLRVRIHAPRGELWSTIGQLNFFFWAHNTGILDWCRAHRDEIEHDMNETSVRTKRHKVGRRPHERRRTELSTAPPQKVAIFERGETNVE